jgi:hypothetical protein
MTQPRCSSGALDDQQNLSATQRTPNGLLDVIERLQEFPDMGASLSSITDIPGDTVVPMDEQATPINSCFLSLVSTGFGKDSPPADE